MTESGGGGKRQLVGRHRPKDKIKHHEGFHLAIEDALANHDWPAGDHDASVHFGAVVNVTNPGVIHEYVVRIEADV
ncbi:MAG TPA: hypothetical protein VF101_14545 [Gaiellaceae bacterium]